MVIMIEKVAEYRRTHNHDLNPCQVPMADGDDDTMLMKTVVIMMMVMAIMMMVMTMTMVMAMVFDIAICQY